MNIREELKQLAHPINQFKTHPRNVRQGDVGAITESLNAHGQYRAIVVQKSTGYVLAGNHTLMAARALGWKEVAATFVDCDDEQALRILLVDNRANDLAMYDDRALADVLKELASTDLGLEGSLFNGDDLDDLIYRLEGTTGNATEGKSLTEESDKYAENDTRTLMLPYRVSEYTDLVTKLSAIRSSFGDESNSAVFKRIVDQAYEDLQS
jgi:hypothetical protein